MKRKQLTLKQKTSVACPICGVAAGKGCILVVGSLRNEPHPGRKLLAAKALEKKESRSDNQHRVNVPKKKEKESTAALLARLRKELAKPHLSKSVREKATKKQIARWNAR